MSPVLLGLIDSQKSGHLTLPASFDYIASTTVGAGGIGTITFNSIPQTYKHLQIRGYHKLTGVSYEGYTRVRFNNDTATNYSQKQWYANTNNALTTNTYTSETSTTGAWIGDSMWSSGVTDILDYTNTNKKRNTRTWSGGYLTTSTGYAVFPVGQWNSTSAISRIDIIAPNSGNFAQYTVIALYGLKG